MKRILNYYKNIKYDLETIIMLLIINMTVPMWALMLKTPPITIIHISIGINLASFIGITMSVHEFKKEKKEKSNEKIVYGICSGRYSDWGVDYIFESEEKRNIVMEKLNIANRDCEYEPVDYNLADNDFDVENYEDFAYVKCNYTTYKNGEIEFNFDVIKTNSIAENKIKIERLSFSEIRDCRREIYLKRIIHNSTYDETKLREKYLKICRDYMAMATYYTDVEELSKEAINERFKTIDFKEEELNETTNN